MDPFLILQSTQQRTEGGDMERLVFDEWLGLVPHGDVDSEGLTLACDWILGTAGYRVRIAQAAKVRRIIEAIIANSVLATQDNQLIQHGTLPRQPSISHLRGSCDYAPKQDAKGRKCLAIGKSYDNHPGGQVPWSQKLFKSILDHMALAGLVTLDRATKAESGQGIASTFTPTDRLCIYLAWSQYSKSGVWINADNIIRTKPAIELRSKNLQQMTQAQMENANVIAARLRTINALMRENKAEYTTMDGLLVKVPAYKLALRRIFGGTLQSFGRFYGGLELLRKDERRTITLRGEETVSLDYRAMHPSIAYHLADVEYSGNVYRVKRGQSSDETIVVKRIMLAAMNANSRRVLQRVMNDIEEDRLKGIGVTKRFDYRMVKRLAEYIDREHKAISGYMYGGASGLFQYIDSEIAEQVLLSFAMQDRPIIPVHDGFIVRRSDADHLANVLVASARCVVGDLQFKLE